MSGRLGAVAALALVSGLAVLPAGCTYDYLQNTDRVSYRAGNAVRSNIAMETANPWRADMYDTRGLGKDGVVTPAAAGSTAASSTSSTSTSTTTVTAGQP